MIGRALDARVPASWVAGDEVHGSDPGLREDLETRQIRYVLAIARTHPVATSAGPAPAARLPWTAWQRYPAGPGPKGQRYYDWAWLRIDPAKPGHPPHGRPGHPARARRLAPGAMVHLAPSAPAPSRNQPLPAASPPITNATMSGCPHSRRVIRPHITPKTLPTPCLLRCRAHE